jgi:hypothetical protein
MKCPNCGESLWFVKDVCPFCKTTISREATAASTPASPKSGTVPCDSERLVTLVQCGTVVEADAVRAQLETADIPSFLPDEALMQAVAWNVNTYGFVRVQVFSKDYEAAKEVLSSFRQDAEGTAVEPGLNLAEVPLSWPMRCFAFAMPVLICPGLLIFAVAKGGYSKQGCERKEKELWQWFAGGVLFWVIVFMVFAMIHEFM